MEDILIIDDSRHVTELLSQHILPFHGYHVRVALTGWEGLSAIKQQAPDLILLDLQLPDTSGLELLRQLGELGHDIPVILMTAHGSEQAAVEAFRLGARNYLIKPFAEDEVVTGINRALRERRLQREKEQLNQHLQQRLRQLTVLSSIGKSVTALLSIEDLLERIIEASVYVTRAEEGFLLLTDPLSNELYLRAAKNLGEERVRHLRMPLDDSLAGQVIQTRRAVRLNQASSGGLIKLKTGYLVQSLLQVPLLVGQKAIGVLGVDNRLSARDFSESDQHLLAALADYAAIALENARLFEQRRESEERYRELFDNANDLIFTLDRQLRITSVNCKAYELLGEAPEALLGRSLAQLSDAEHWPEGCAQLAALLDGTVERGLFGLLLRRCDGQLRHIEVNARLTQAGALPGGIHCVARDVTERQRLEEQLLHSEKLSLLGQLVAGVAHELNNPLTSVAGYTELLLSRDDLDDQVRRDLQLIRAQGQRAAHIVEHLLAFSRQQQTRHVPVDLNALLEQALSLYEYRLHIDNVRVLRRLETPLPPVKGDAPQLQQVLLNLLTNANQAMAGMGGGTLTVRSWRLDNQVLLSVSDTGRGMPQEVLARIFEPFYTTKPAGEGTGLGLSICHGIISKHDGEIWAESAIGQGSTFFVALPVDAAALLESEPESLHEPGMLRDVLVVPRRGAGRRVLVVEDEEGIAELLSRLLQQLGHAATVARNGEEALQLLDDWQFDLVLTDIRMPGMDGFQLFSQIYTRFPEMARRVVFTTGDTMSPATQALLAQIGNQCIPKPFSSEVLTRVLNTMLPSSSSVLPV